MTVFIQKGDAPMSEAQAVARGRALLESQLPAYQREAGSALGSPEYAAFAAGWLADNEINLANNRFNHQLAAVRKARQRLAQYKLADGRPEVTREDPTGSFDADTGEPLFTTVIVRHGVMPLPATVVRPIVDESTGEQTGAEEVQNPAITQDEMERAAAQAVIDAMPAEVIDFDGT